MLHVACPSCGARYHVPDAKLGKHAACVKCGTRFTLAPPPTSPSTADDPPFDFEGLAGGAVQPSAPAPKSAGGVHALASAALATGALSSAAEPTDAASFKLRTAIPRYLGDVVGTLGLMTTPTGLIIMLMLCGLQALKLLAPYALCLGILMTIVLNGYVLSYYLHVLVSGTARDDSLPSLALSDGIVEDILVPLVKFFAVFLVTLLPFAAVVIWLATAGRMETEMAGLILAGVLSFDFSSFVELTAEQALLVLPPLAFGQILQPMFLLVVAVGGIRCLWRADLMVRTVIGTLPAYLVLLALFWGLTWATSLIESAAAAATGPQAGGVPGAVIGIGTMAIDTLVTVFTMRAIGLFYHHFKPRFAWSWG